MGTRFGGLFREANSDARRLDAFSLTDELRPLGWLNLDLQNHIEISTAHALVVLKVLSSCVVVVDISLLRFIDGHRGLLLKRGLDCISAPV